MHQRCLALDFDGVIVDSIQECLVTAHNAFMQHLGKSDFRVDLGSFSAEFLDSFRTVRNFIRRGEDYVYILLAAHRGEAIWNQQGFDAFSDANDELRDRFRELFYGQRQDLQNHYPEEWLALNPLYPGIAGLLSSMDRDLVYIVTTKDLASVRMILGNQRIVLDDAHLYQATKTYRKPEILQQIAGARGCSEEEIIFIDDHTATVLEVAGQTRVSIYFADWGYHSPEQKDQILEQNIKILSLEDLQILTASQSGKPDRGIKGHHAIEA